MGQVILDEKWISHLIFLNPAVEIPYLMNPGENRRRKRRDLFMGLRISAMSSLSLSYIKTEDME